MIAGEARRTAERVARDSYGRLVAFLAARTRDVAGAEDALAEAFASAGYDVTTIKGGITAWVVEGKEIEPEDGYVSEPGEAAAILEARARNK